jgi:hypothetical protein
MGLVHAFSSAKADTSDATKVQPSHWNQNHKLSDSGLAYAAAANGDIASVAAGQNYLQLLRRKFNASSSEEYEFVSPNYLRSTDFDFEEQTPASNLTASISNTVTLSPCPLGVAGANTEHYLYIEDGVAGNETILITGGTATSGAASGTITFTPTLNHTSGNWTIKSASAGIQEALNYESSPSVYVPKGTHQIYATIKVPLGAKIFGNGGRMSSGSGETASIQFSKTNATLFKVYADKVCIKGLRLGQNGGTATSGSIAIDVLNGGSGSAGSGVLKDLDIYAFYNALRVDGTSNYFQQNIQAANCEGDAFVEKAAQGYVSNLQAMNCKGNGFTIAIGTNNTNASPLMRGVHSYGNGGWGVYATYPIQIIDSFLNNESLGNLYVNVSGADAGFIGHANLQFAGDQPNGGGYTAGSTTAPGIYIASGSAPLRVIDCNIFAPAGNGIDNSADSCQIIGNRILGAGDGAQSGSQYSIRCTGSSCLVTSNTGNTGARLSGSTSSFLLNNFSSVNADAALYVPSGTNIICSDNTLYSGGAGNALTIGSGVTAADGYNICIGTVSNAAVASDYNSPTIPNDTWYAPSLQNSWVNFDAANSSNAGYLKMKEGPVALRGVMKDGTFADGTTVFNVPAGYRPIKTVTLDVVANGTACRVTIDTAGDVKVYGLSSAAFLSLDGKTYWTN